MADFLLPFVVIALVVVIIAQAVERYFYGEQMQRELSKLIAAFLSKNIGDYTHAVRVEKEPKARLEHNPDEVSLDDASPEEFDKFIQQQL